MVGRRVCGWGRWGAGFEQGGAVTQNSGPDPFEVSDSGTMLKYLKEKK